MEDAAATAAEGEEFTYEVPPGTRAERADKWLAAQRPEDSRSRIQAWFEAGRVWREDAAIEKADKVRPGDVLVLSVPAVRPATLRPVALPLDILFEDEDLLAINKAPGMVVHPGAGTGEDTLVHALLHHCAGRLSGIGGIERPGIVHRLDRETSGVMVAAKTDRAFLVLSRAFAERSVEKHYTAIVQRAPAGALGTIDQPIGRHPVQRQRMAIRSDGRSARSDWRVRQRLARGYAWLDVQIHTGRTHQIRVHLNHLGCPIAGDPTYGFREADPIFAAVFPRVMLHAQRLVLLHPVHGQPLSLEAPVPADFQRALESCRMA